MKSWFSPLLSSHVTEENKKACGPHNFHLSLQFHWYAKQKKYAISQQLLLQQILSLLFLLKQTGC
jgi:hypothetical protein